MANYFKVVSLYESKEKWMYEELKEGRFRFGWSWKGCDLNKLKETPRELMTSDQKTSWRMTQFLVKRLEVNDILVIQLERPFREIYLAKVVGDYYFDDNPQLDFNHIIPIVLINEKSISISSEIITNPIRHDLTKRGHYYAIYPENTIEELSNIINKKLWKDPKAFNQRTKWIEFDRTRQIIINNTIKSIKRNWKSKDFEIFVGELIEKIPNIEVKLLADQGKGWDLLIQIIDPLTGVVLHDEVPVQCKNYSGKVLTNKPIKDLERCIFNTSSNIAYLFIMGSLTPKFYNELEKVRNILSIDNDIDFRIMTEDRIAELYLMYFDITNDSI